MRYCYRWACYCCCCYCHCHCNISPLNLILCSCNIVQKLNDLCAQDYTIITLNTYVRTSCHLFYPLYKTIHFARFICINININACCFILLAHTLPLSLCHSLSFLFFLCVCLTYFRINHIKAKRNIIIFIIYCRESK